MQQRGRDITTKELRRILDQYAAGIPPLADAELNQMPENVLDIICYDPNDDS